jgi:hypothetical protein
MRQIEEMEHKEMAVTFAFSTLYTHLEGKRHANEQVGEKRRWPTKYQLEKKTFFFVLNLVQYGMSSRIRNRQKQQPGPEF